MVKSTLAEDSMRETDLFKEQELDWEIIRAHSETLSKISQILWCLSSLKNKQKPLRKMLMITS